MPNIVIDQVQLNGWTGEAWQYNGRVTSDNGYQTGFTAITASLLSATVNGAIKSAAIGAIQDAGAGTVGLGDAKLLVGGVVII